MPPSTPSSLELNSTHFLRLLWAVSTALAASLADAISTAPVQGAPRKCLPGGNPFASEHRFGALRSLDGSLQRGHDDGQCADLCRLPASLLHLVRDGGSDLLADVLRGDAEVRDVG